jgi:5-deoxy-D-glucuronate isomerase
VEQSPNLQLVHQTGFAIDGTYTEAQLADAVTTATASDVTIVCMGESPYAEALGNIDGVNNNNNNKRFTK